MKTIMITLALACMATQSEAAVKHGKYKDVVEGIKELEKMSLYKEAAITAASTANLLADSSKFDQMVESMERTLVVKRKEVVTETESAGGGFNILFGLFKGVFSWNYDTAQILTMNAKQVAKFSSVKEKDLKKIQKNLDSFVVKNETELFYAKILTAKAMELTQKIDVAEIADVYNYIRKTAQRVSMVNFSGFQKIITCTKTKYADRSDGFSVALSGLIDFNFSEKEERHAYKETTCSDESVETSTSELALHSTELMLADLLLKHQSTMLDLKILKEETAPEYPIWGLPYMNP